MNYNNNMLVKMCQLWKLCDCYRGNQSVMVGFEVEFIIDNPCPEL